MASIHDWVRLAQDTLRSLETRQVTGLYELEWPEMKRRLTAEHEEAIAGQPGRIRRFIRTASAIMYGLTKRLAPQRRVLFVTAQLMLIWGILSSSHEDGVQIQMRISLFGAFLMITLLLGMELIDKIKYRDELELARELQAGLIPKVLPQPEGFSLAAFNHIANTVGGDIYDFIPLPDGRLAVLFGDASGHGMAAGLIMAVAHATFRTQLDVDASPAAMFTTLNRILCQTGGSRSFFAGVYLIGDREGRFEMAIAGHPQVLVVAGDGTITRSIGSGSYPLGVKRDYAWTVEHGRLDSGESLLFHSDGLVESRNAHGLEFGDERVATICGWTAGRTAPEILAAIVTHWKLFTEMTPADDDVSVAVIRRS